MLGAAAAAIQGRAGAAASTYVGRVIGYNPDWYLPLGDPMATALIGPSGNYVNSPQLGVTSIAQDDANGKSTGLSGAASNPPHIAVSSPLTAADFTVDLIVQLDDLTKSKHILITTGGGPSSGDFSVEVLVNGQLRCWSEISGTVHEILGSAGDVSQGTAVKITYERQSGGSWSQRVYVNGVIKAEDTTPRTWDALPSQTWYVGAWSDGSDAMDGLVAHVAGWNSLLTPAQIQDLARAQSAAWAENIDAGAVQASQSTVVSVRQGGWHGKLPLTVTAGDGAFVTTTESGEDITVTAGGTTGNDDTFSYSFTDANGRTSPTRMVTIDVVAAPVGVSIGALTAFQPSRIRVTALAGWPAGRTPKEVVAQGTHAHGYVRRSWKPSNNNGTWMDFQAGWRKTTAADVIRIKLDDNSELDLSYTVNNSIPSPGSGGTTRTLDKLGGADYTTWSAAIAALNNNDVLVVRARAGGEVYPVDVNVGGPASTASGVKVVAHPDDLAAGRRPRIHQQGTVFARYADQMNSGHWEVYQALGGAHGNVWRSTLVVGTNKVNIGCSYRTKSGGLKRCFTYTNTSGTPGALARLQDTTYPRISRSNLGTWDLYMGPGIYLHTDGRLYIRLSPLRAGIGAIQVNASAGVGPNPPWDWSDDDPANENPNQCQLYISSTNDYDAEGTQPTTGLSYLLRINSETNWTLENLDFVGGGNTIEMNFGSGHTLRGCRFLGWAPPNMAGEDNTSSTVSRVHNMLEAEGTHNILCDRCEFWGGMAPWNGWQENKAQWGAYSVAHKLNLWWQNDGTSDSFSCTFRHCKADGFALINRRGGKLRYIKFHHSRLSYCGMDGLIGSQVPWQNYECLRTKMIESSFGGWIDENEVDGVMYVGYCLLVNVRPCCHDTAYWDDRFSQANMFVCIAQTIGHGGGAGFKELEKQYWYNNTAIGAHNHMRASTTKANANMVRDGAGAFIFPYNVNRWYLEWFSRNNILAVRPNGSLGDATGTRIGGAWGDSHVGVVLHPNHVGNQVTNPIYSCDYNIYHRGSGMPTLGSGHNNSVVTTVDASGSELARNSITDVRSDTGQEMNGRFADPQFVGAWDATKLDTELHSNAFWCLEPGSPAETGGDMTNRAWLDVDFGSVITYGGQSWLGCMDPDASAVEQQVGPLGPMPSGL